MFTRLRPPVKLQIPAVGRLEKGLSLGFLEVSNPMPRGMGARRTPGRTSVEQHLTVGPGAWPDFALLGGSGVLSRAIGADHGRVTRCDRRPFICQCPPCTAITYKTDRLSKYCRVQRSSPSARRPDWSKGSEENVADRSVVSGSEQTIAAASGDARRYMGRPRPGLPISQGGGTTWR
jgi:hypothetical protein